MGIEPTHRLLGGAQDLKLVASTSKNPLILQVLPAFSPHFGGKETQQAKILCTFPAPNWETLLEAYLIYLQAKNLSPLTLHSYAKSIKTFARFVGKNPLEVTPDDIRKFLQSCPHSPTTKAKFLREIHAFFNFLVREGWLKVNPASKVEKVKIPEVAPRTLTDDQVVALVNTIAQHAHTFAGLRDLALVVLLLDTGLRVSEAVNLTFDDLDLSQGFVKVMGKGGKERSVPISNMCKLVLARYLARRKLIVCPTNKVFITSYATPLTRYVAARRVAFYAKKAGIKGVKTSPHSLRFTFVRKWLESGGDSLILQRILGHTIPIMTSYYARLFATDLKTPHEKYTPLANLPLKLPRQRIR